MDDDGKGIDDLENRVRKGLIKQTWEELEAGDHPVSSASAHLVY